MEIKKKLAVGSMLATVGTLGIFLLMILDVTSLVRPWSFLVGFVFGVSAGAGAALSVYALVMRRMER